MATKAHFTGLPGAGRTEHLRIGMKVGTKYAVSSPEDGHVTVAGKTVLPVSCFPWLDPDYRFACDSGKPDVKQASYLADRWGCSRESAQYLWPSAYPERMAVMLRGAALPLKTDKIKSLDELPVAAIVAATGWSEYTLKGWLGKPRYAARLWDIVRGLDGGLR